MSIVSVPWTKPEDRASRLMHGSVVGFRRLGGIVDRDVIRVPGLFYGCQMRQLLAALILLQLTVFVRVADVDDIIIVATGLRQASHRRSYAKPAVPSNAKDNFGGLTC